MEKKILAIINKIREAKGLLPVAELKAEDRLRDDLDLTSLDLAELTVIIEDESGIDIFEDGLVSTIGEIYTKLS